MDAAARARFAQATAEISALMRRYKITVDDLISVGGNDLKSPNPQCVEKARRVERAWAAMARLELKFVDIADLTPAAQQTPTQRARAQRGEGGFLEAIENTAVSGLKQERETP
jgi:hypothetical protein